MTSLVFNFVTDYYRASFHISPYIGKYPMDANNFGKGYMTPYVESSVGSYVSLGRCDNMPQAFKASIRWHY